MDAALKTVPLTQVVVAGFAVVFCRCSNAVLKLFIVYMTALINMP